MKLPASALVVFFFLSSLGISSAAAQSWPPQRPPACVPHRSAQPKPVPRTVNVTVPVPHKAPQAMCAPYPCCPPAPPVSRRPASMPVQVQVSVQAAPSRDGSCARLVYRDQGPIKPILQYGTALIGATIAAPFRLADMFLECRTRRACRPMVPVCQAPRCGPPVRKCAAPRSEVFLSRYMCSCRAVGRSFASSCGSVTMRTLSSPSHGQRSGVATLRAPFFDRRAIQSAVQSDAKGTHFGRPE